RPTGEQPAAGERRQEAARADADEDQRQAGEIAIDGRERAPDHDRLAVRSALSQQGERRFAARHMSGGRAERRLAAGSPGEWMRTSPRGPKIAVKIPGCPGSSRVIATGVGRSMPARTSAA